MGGEVGGLGHRRRCCSSRCSAPFSMAKRTFCTVRVFIDGDVCNLIAYNGALKEIKLLPRRSVRWRSRRRPWHARVYGG
jgi:hypothetical protein